jgi:hypothetical protein
MKSSAGERESRLISAVLSGAWRSSDFPPLELTEAELEEVAPLLNGSGASALAWHRISQTSLSDSPAGETLHQAYRLLSLQSELHEQKVQTVFRVLQKAGVDAILAKGWAAAGMYADRALRPFGDIDICVRPYQAKLARDVLTSPEAAECWVDLHTGFSEINERSFDDLLSRSTSIQLAQAEVRTLGLEDHVALLATHFLKHGGWRPLWLCDIGAALEFVPPTFDWKLCLGSNPTKARWISCAFGLAELLLGARVPASASFSRTDLPPWLVMNVRKAWANPYARFQPPMSHPMPVRELIKHPSRWIEGLRERWPNPIIATVSVNGEFNNRPRLPYQMANCFYRIGRVFHSSGEVQ